jgi:hypothetical protein
MYYGTDWTVTRSGTVLKFVRCEQCNHDYAYWMHRKIEHSSFSALGLDNRGAVSRAAREANDRLDRALRKSCDPVPCPECGHYQEAMVARARRIRLIGLWNFGIALIPLSLGAGLLAGSFFQDDDEKMILAFIAGLGATLVFNPIVILGRYWSNKHHDPNTKSAERRIKLGRRLALAPREYERAVAKYGPNRRS